MNAGPPTVPQPWGEGFRGLGLTCDIATAAKILGIGRTTAFDLLRRGRFPVEVIALNRVRRVRTADLFAYLRVPVPNPAQGAPGPPTPSRSGSDDDDPRAA